MACNAEKVYSRGLEKNSSQTKSPVPSRKSQMANPLGGGGRNGFDTSVNDIHQHNGGRAIITLVVFKTNVLRFKIEILR